MVAEGTPLSPMAAWEEVVIQLTWKVKNQKFKEVNPKSHSPEGVEIDTKSKVHTLPFITQ